MSKPTTDTGTKVPNGKRSWTYTWLGGMEAPEGVIEPIERVPGPWAEAWAERMRKWNAERKP